MGKLQRRRAVSPEGKYNVTRRSDGTKPAWPWFVLGAKDPAAAVALRVYADECERLGMESEFSEDVRTLADEFDQFRKEHGKGNPDAG